jgi:hypothetical protein
MEKMSQEIKTMHSGRIKTVCCLLLILELTAAGGCGRTASQTIKAPVDFTGITSTNATSGNGLSLSLSVNSTEFQPSQGISIVIEERNTLTATNNVTTSKNWPLKGLSTGPCGTLNYSFGISIFKGYYTSANVSSAVPLKLYDPGAIYHCPAVLSRIDSYAFQPSSNEAAIFGSCEPNPCASIEMSVEVNYQGDWMGSPKEAFNDFTSGIYTIAGGDEWGTTVLLYFVVTE